MTLYRPKMRLVRRTDNLTMIPGEVIYNSKGTPIPFIFEGFSPTAQTLGDKILVRKIGDDKIIETYSVVFGDYRIDGSPTDRKSR